MGPNAQKLYNLGKALGLPELCDQASGEPHIKWRGKVYTIEHAPPKAIDHYLRKEGLDPDALQAKLEQRIAEVKSRILESKEQAELTESGEGE